MQRNGVQWLRTGFDWSQTQPGPFQLNWALDDNVVAAAANHGLHLLPVVEFTPQWASTHPSSGWLFYAPKSPSLYANFMTLLVQRYGPGGTFWKANPGVRYMPVRAWQIWNEPEGTNYDWRSAPWPKTYTALLKAAYAAVHRADRGATVVSGALVALNCTGCVQWQEAGTLYRAGFGHYFDALAVNTFSYSPSVAKSVQDDITILDRVRAVMRSHHDAAKPIWITEFTWTAVRSYHVPKMFYDGFETTSKGQAQRLTALYTRLATRHPDGVQRAFWFDWSSPYLPHPVLNGDVTFQYAGLVKWTIGDPVFTPLPVLKAYAGVAKRYG
jgi:hypothetical protein